MNKYYLWLILSLNSINLFPTHAISAEIPTEYGSFPIESYYKLDISRHSDFHHKLTIKNKNNYGIIYNFHRKISLDENIKKEIFNSVKNELRKYKINHKWLEFNISGPIKITLSGTSNGGVRFYISGVNIQGDIKGTLSRYLNIYLKFIIKNSKLSGEIDLASSEIISVEFSSDFDLDVNSNLKYILPGINLIIKKTLKSNVKKFMKEAVNDYNNHSPFYNLSTIIPSYKYVYDGIDIGWELQQHLSGMIDGQFITMTIEDLPLTPITNPLSCYKPGKSSIKNNIAELNISDKAFFRLRRTDIQKCVRYEDTE